MTDNGVADVVVTALGREVRRRVGPSAWSVLEELVARAGPDPSDGTAVDVRLTELTGALGLSAEVVRSALRRLVTAGLVDRQEQRAADSQRFSCTRYRIVGETGIVVGADAALPHPDRPHADLPYAGERHRVGTPTGANAAGPLTARRLAAQGRQDHPAHRSPRVQPSASPQLSLLETAPGQGDDTPLGGRRQRR